MKVACKAVGHLLGAVGKKLDSEQALLTDLQQNALIRRELSYGAGWIAVNGGRLVALVAALAHVGCHTESSTAAGPDAREPVVPLAESSTAAGPDAREPVVPLAESSTDR